MGIVDEALQGAEQKRSIVDEALTPQEPKKEGTAMRFLKGETNAIVPFLREHAPVSPESNAKAVAETGLSLLTGVPSFFASKGAGAITGLATGDVEKAKQAEEFVGKYGTYQPQEEAAQKAVESIGKVVDIPFSGARALGKTWGEQAGSPLAGYLVGTGLELAAPSIAKPVIGAVAGEVGRGKVKPAEVKAVEKVTETPKPEKVSIVEEAIGETKAGDIRPAVRYLDQVFEGKRGELHSNIWERMPDEIKERNTDIASGWVDSEGNWLDRKDVIGKSPLVTKEGYAIESKGLSDLAAERTAAEARGSFSLEKKGEAAPPAVTFEKAIEERFQAAKGTPQEGTLTRFSGFLEEMKNKLTRTYEHLPRTAEFAEAQFALKRLEKQREVTNQRAIIEKADELAGLDKQKYDLFTRKVILDDLVREAEQGRKLPFGFTPESLDAARVKVNAALAEAPEVQTALAKRKASWDRMKADYTQAMSDIGFDVSERLKNDAYFRHQVIEYADAKRVMGTGKKLKTPTGRGFLKKREGSTLDINTDYLEAEFEVYGQMMHDIEIARTIKHIDNNYNIADRVRKEAKAKGFTDWRQAVPEGYTTWQPREGNVFYMADTIPAKLAEQLYSGALEEIGVTAADLKKAMSMGGKRREFVIKQELADTLDNLGKETKRGLFIEGDRQVLKGWKVWQLISPRRLIKYNLRNLTGDADAGFVGNPSGFSKVPQAVHDLWQVYVAKKPMTPEMEMWFDRGGMQANLQAAEISALKDLWVFDRLYTKNKGIADLPKEVWQKYWKTARISTDFREGILRYANFLDYLDQVKKDPAGRPRNFGASIPEEIMGLSNPVDRAYWLSNDLLGAYDRVSVFGQAMREHVFPFWSWKEVNMKRYKQFIQNAINEGNLAETVGRKALGTAAKSPLIAARVGGFLIKATAFWSLLQAWNHLKYPEEERSLSEEMRQKPHIILGRDEKGDIIYFNRIGALGDILEWFGLDAAPKQVDKWLSGSATLKEVAQEMGTEAVKGPLNVFASGSVPFAKLALETATRRSTFPDVTKPSTIRDRGLYLARSFGLENEYIAATGKPSMGYGQSLRKMAVYTTDPLEGAYRDVFELKSDFQKKMGKSAEGFWLTPKGDALYNMKLALKFGDKEAFQKYAAEYLQLGGKPEGMKQSLKMMEPLGGMSANEKKVFIASLKPEDQEKVAKAYQFYSFVLLGQKAASNQ